MVKHWIIILLIFCAVGTTNSLPALAKEKPLPVFRITGYIEKINADSINIFVPRMKQSLSLWLSQDIKIIDFTAQDSRQRYTIKDLRVKDMAVCEGVIDQQGFICKSIAFVRATSILNPAGE